MRDELFAMLGLYHLHKKFKKLRTELVYERKRGQIQGSLERVRKRETRENLWDKVF